MTIKKEPAGFNDETATASRVTLVDGTGAPVVITSNVVALASGGATEAKQDTQITLATSLNGYVDGLETLATATNTKLDTLIGQVAADFKYLAISVATSGDNQLLAAVAAKKFAIVSYVLVADAAVTVKFRSNSVDLSGAMALAANGVVSLRGSRAEPLMLTGTVNQSLVLTLGGAVGVRGHLTYIEV